MAFPLACECNVFGAYYVKVTTAFHVGLHEGAVEMLELL
jgi:hypothetical protein